VLFSASKSYGRRAGPSMPVGVVDEFKVGDSIPSATTTMRPGRSLAADALRRENLLIIFGSLADVVFVCSESAWAARQRARLFLALSRPGRLAARMTTDRTLSWPNNLADSPPPSRAHPKPTPKRRKQHDDWRRATLAICVNVFAWPAAKSAALAAANHHQKGIRPSGGEWWANRHIRILLCVPPVAQWAATISSEPSTSTGRSGNSNNTTTTTTATKQQSWPARRLHGAPCAPPTCCID
jgi:hypothetical protein